MTKPQPPPPARRTPLDRATLRMNPPSIACSASSKASSHPAATDGWRNVPITTTNSSRCRSRWERGKRAVMYCHARCDTRAVVAAIGLTMADLFAWRHQANPSRGTKASKRKASRRARASSRRTTTPTRTARCSTGLPVRAEDGGFPQRRPTAAGDWEWGWATCRPSSIALPDLIEAVATLKRVFIVEGEKDVDNVVAYGLSSNDVAIGRGQVARGIRPSLPAHVVILPDNDDARPRTCGRRGSLVRSERTSASSSLPTSP
jgi:hypothetical protein